MLLRYQELSHPHEEEGEQSGVTEQEPDESDAIVADILTIAQSPVFGSVHSRQARRSLADHLVEEAEDWHAPLTEEERMQIASAAFDEHRWVQSGLDTHGIMFSKVCWHFA